MSPLIEARQLTKNFGDFRAVNDLTFQVEAGEIFGLIRFGSRVDVIVPYETEISVKLGDRVKGGETILGVLK